MIYISTYDLADSLTTAWYRFHMTSMAPVISLSSTGMLSSGRAHRLSALLVLLFKLVYVCLCVYGFVCVFVCVCWVCVGVSVRRQGLASASW